MTRAHRLLLRRVSLVLAASAACSAPVRVPEGSTAYEIAGARWFDGTAFTPRTMYVIDRSLSIRRPERVDSVLDLSGGWIIPPFADAHTHNLDGAFGLAAIRAAYRAEGTWYVQVLTNTATGAAGVRDSFRLRGTIDVRYANAGITATLGHPFLAYEPRAIGIMSPDDLAARADELCLSRRRLGNAYWFVDDEGDLEGVWPRWLESSPEVLKIFLLRAGEPRAPDPCTDMGHRGLDPALVPEIVRRAHAAGLRVWAHVETAHDFDVAVRAGVDGIAHSPGYQKETAEPALAYTIDSAAARLAGERRVAITPTVALADVFADSDPARRLEILALQRSNLELLMRNGVRVVVGSDYYGRTARGEVEAMRALGLWTNLDLLRMWAVETPRVVFPERRVGELGAGAEASFLVLECDPIQEWECTGRVRAQIKDGVRVPEPPAPEAPGDPAG